MRNHPTSIDLTDDRASQTKASVSGLVRHMSSKRTSSDDKADNGIGPGELKRRKTVDGIDPGTVSIAQSGSAGVGPAMAGSDMSGAGGEPRAGSRAMMENPTPTPNPETKLIPSPVKPKQVYEGNYKEEAKVLVDFGGASKNVALVGGGPALPVPAPVMSGHQGNGFSGGLGSAGPISDVGVEAGLGGNGADRLLCVICQDADRHLLFIPCSHICACKSCFAKGIEKCPICREPIQDSSPVFLS